MSNSDSIIKSPDDPGEAKNYRLMIGIVVTLGILILVAIGFLIVGFVHKGSKSEAPATPVAAKPVSMTLAPGYRILSSDSQPGRLILHVRSNNKDEIDIIDLADGHIVAQIHTVGVEGTAGAE
jgi:plastocyanin domain-containing protein